MPLIPGLGTVEENHKQICTLKMLYIPKMFVKSVHLKMAKYIAYDSNQNNYRITEESNTNERPKATTYIFFGHFLA